VVLLTVVLRVVLSARGLKPSLSPNLNTLSLIEAAGAKRLFVLRGRVPGAGEKDTCS